MATEILIDDVIGPDPWFGEISARLVRSQLAAAGADGEVVVRVNSPGGYTSEGVAIYTMLSAHKGRVVVQVEGIAASAASVVAMAGDEIRVAQGAMLMVHEAWSICMGRADDMLAAAEMLRKTTESIAGIYVARTGQTAEKIAEMLAAETWLTAEEAVQLGFADSMVAAKAKPAPDSKASARALASYRNVPQALLRTPPSNSAQRAPARAAIATPMAQLSRRA